MDALPPNEALARWLDWQIGRLFPPTLESALTQIARQTVAASRAGGRRRSMPVGSRAFLRRIDRLKTDRDLEALVERGGWQDAMRVMAVLEELRAYARAASPSDPAYQAVHNRLAMHPSVLLACRLSLERFAGER